MEHYVYILQDPRKIHFEKGGYELPYEPFYVGKGKGNRCNEWSDRNPLVKNKINKIISLNLTPYVTKIYSEEQEAFDAEIELIKAFGRKVLNEGPLLNLMPGGEGGFTYINQFLSNGMKGKPAWNRGISHSNETKEKIRQKALGRSNPMKGKKNPKTSQSLMGHVVSEETRQKLRLANLGRKRI